ncbi:OmpL47-type beta-barrel domain-containing protein [Paenisporosarcina sp. NPDC076898]|uniref:OmpL47-type beta-barrel domain-containing protein n=1 Tax=unclassified Paenisporosarcina TaxID=2642018 RepID=UPI003CFBFCE0
MNKQTIKLTSYLALLLLLIQMLNPFAIAFASTNSNILPPSNLATQQVTPDDVKLTWSPVFGATGYNVYEIQEGQLTLLGKSTSTSYNLNNLAEGSYRYVVSTLSAEGESGPCAPISVDIIYPEMQAPSAMTQTIRNGNDIVLSWGTSAYIEKYNLYKLTDDGQKTLLTSTTNKTFTVSDAPEGNFKYAVSAMNTLYGESSLSDVVQGEVVYPIMTMPANFTYSVTNGSDITLKWDAVPYATNYKLYQIVDGQSVLKNTLTTTTAKVTNLPAGDYIYEIRSNSDRFGESTESNKLAVTVSSVTMIAPDNFAYKLQNTNDILLTWESVPYASSYKVYQIVDGEKVLKSTVASTSVSYPKVAAGDYVYEVYSFSDRFGESTEGSRVGLSVEGLMLEAPSNIEYKIQNGNDIVLNWSSSANATSYKVYQIVDGQKVLRSTVTGTSVTYSNKSAGDYDYEVFSFSDRFGESKDGISVSFALVHPTMKPPANVKETLKSETSFTLSWDAADYATNYKIYQIVNGQKILKSTVTGASVTYSNMPSGDYVYEIYSSSSKFGESTNGAQVSFNLKGQTMQAPQNLTNTITNGNDIKLSWTAVEKATNYKVYQVIDGVKVQKSNSATLSITYSNMPAGDYTYVVHSNSSTHGESEFGAEITFSLVHPTIKAPENVTHKIQNGNDVVLSWIAAPNANSYKVYELVDGQKILRSSSTTLTTILSKVPAGEHLYVIHSVSTRFGESLNGSELVVKQNEYTMQAPENVIYNIANGNDISLKWDASTNATSYKVYRVINEQRELVKTVTSNLVSLSNMPEGDYTYEVHSFSDRFGESPEGSEVSVTVLYPVMQAPLNLTQSITNGNDIVLRWNASTYASSYKVYQKIDGQLILRQTVVGTSATFRDLPEGEYEFEVHSESTRFGESPEGITVGVSLTWPVVQPPVLTGDFFNINNVTLSWKSVPWANEYRVYQTIGDTRKLIYKGSSLTNKVYNVTEDTHSFEVSAYSTKFGESNPSNIITKEIVYPVMQPPVANVTVLSNSSTRITWDFVTYANGYNVYQMNEGSPVLIAEKVNNLSYTVSNLSYANHEFYVTSHGNSFGESEPSNVVMAKLIVDTEEPVTTISVPKDWVNQKTVVTLSATDNETGVANTYYSVNDSEFLEGNLFEIEREGIHKVSFYSVDKVGNKESVQTSYVKIDQTAPETMMSGIPVWSTQPVDVTLTTFDGQSGIANTYYSINGSEYLAGTTFTLYQEGINEVSFYSVDQAGNKEKVQTFELKIDKNAPHTSLNEVSKWIMDSMTVELTSKDDLSGISKTYYSVNGSEFLEGTSLVITDEGINKVSFYSEDNAGNKEEVKTKEVKIDRTAPETISNVTGEWHSDLMVELIAKDNESGISATYYSLNGSEYVKGSSFTVGSDGIYEISFYSVDEAGNKEDAKTQEVKIDQSAPKTTSNVMDDWQQGFTVELTTLDDLSGVSATYYSVNGSEFKDGTNFTLTEQGINKISYYSVDKAGNKEDTKTEEVRIDQSAPETGSNVTADWNKEFTVELISKDELSGVSKTYYSVNGTEFVKGKTITVNEEGIHEISFYSVDNAGNVEEVKTVEVKIDPTAPVTTSNVTNEWHKEFTMELVSKDELSGVSATYYSVDGSEFVKGTSLTVTNEGINKVSFYSVDHVGNKEDSKTVEVKIDKTAPTVSWNLKDMYELGTKLPLTYIAKDAGSGIKSEILTVNGKEYKNGESISFTQPGRYSVKVTVTDNTGWTITLEKTISVYIPSASIKVNPGVIKDNGGVFTVDVTLPKGFNLKDFKLETVSINGVSAISSNNGYVKQAEKGQFKFNRDDFDWDNGKQTLEFSGMLGEYLVLGTTEVEVKGSKQGSNNGHHHGFNFWEWLISFVKRAIGLN